MRNSNSNSDSNSDSGSDSNIPVAIMGVSAMATVTLCEDTVVIVVHSVFVVRKLIGYL